MLNFTNKEINFVLVGEEGVGKSSLINIITGVNKAPVSNMHTKTWKLTKYSIDISELTMNFYDIPGIEGKYSDEEIAKEFLDYKFDMILCCLDGTRIRPNGMVRKSINFINKYVPDIPVLFVVTKQNLVQNDENRINEIKSSIREIANQYFKYFGMVSVGNYIPLTKNNDFWQEIINCIPDRENLICENLNNYNKDNDDIILNIQEYITNNYTKIPEIGTIINQKKHFLKKIKLLYSFLCYIYIILCTIIIISTDETCGLFYLWSSIISISLLVLFSIKLYIYVYSSNRFGLFPVSVNDLETEFGMFDGVINYVSHDKYYTKIKGTLTFDNTIYQIETNNETNYCFELCEKKFTNDNYLPV